MDTKRDHALGSLSHGLAEASLISSITTTNTPACEFSFHTAFTTLLVYLFLQRHHPDLRPHQLIHVGPVSVFTRKRVIPGSAFPFTHCYLLPQSEHCSSKQRRYTERLKRPPPSIQPEKCLLNIYAFSLQPISSVTKGCF